MTRKNPVLFITHGQTQCGVYEFGKRISDVLKQSKKYSFIRVECASLPQLRKAVEQHRPVALLYNYMPAVFPWIATRRGSRFSQSNISSIRLPQIGIIHDVTQDVADTATNYRNTFIFNGKYPLINSLFDYYIAPDPTLLLLNPIVYKTGRLIPAYKNSSPLPAKPVIGSFGFATPNKGFEKIVQLVQQQYDEALIRFNIPFADFGDKNGSNARALAEKCRSLIQKRGIALTITHEFLDDSALLDFLAQNTVNIFLYEDKSNRGLSSVIDYAMAVQRPIAVSDSVMFRHLFEVTPSICVPASSLRSIIENGFSPLQKLYTEWSAENLVWEYERILDSILAKRDMPANQYTGVKGTLKSYWRSIRSKPARTFSWLRNSKQATDDDLTITSGVRYTPVPIPRGVSLNRVLDNEARRLYKPAIAMLTELVPKTMAKKIAEANVQQGFVFDTVYRHLHLYRRPKMLCVGSYEDTASMSLKRLGHTIEEVDPMINYSLQEYFTKPTTVKNSYDIIFATSVIEHDPDDESFVQCVAELLAPGGVAVITCDYKDGWKRNEPKPDGNERFYTKHDLQHRLLALMKDCSLVDEPQWDCPDPDFHYLGKYVYTFATMVVRKQ